MKNLSLNIIYEFIIDIEYLDTIFVFERKFNRLRIHMLVIFKQKRKFINFFSNKKIEASVYAYKRTKGRS